MTRKDLRITRFDRVKETLSYLLGCAILLATIALWGTWGVIAYPGNIGALLGWAASGVFLTWLMAPAICYYILELLFSTNSLNVNWSDRAIAYGTALRILKSIHALEGWTTAVMLSHLAQARLRQGHYDAAEKLLKESLVCASKDTRYGDSYATGSLHAFLSDAYFLQDKIIEAELEMEKALEIYDRHKSEVSPLWSNLVLLRLAAVRLSVGELSAAEDQLLKVKQSIDEPIRKLSKEDAWTKAIAEVSCGLNLACVYAQTDRWAEAEALCAKAADSLQDSDVLVRYAPVRSILRLSDTCATAGKETAIEPILELVYEEFRSDPYNPEAVRTLDCYERLLNATNRSNEVADMRSWLRPTPKRIQTDQSKR